MSRWAQRAAYAFSTVVLRRESPYLFGLVVTDHCNLDCFYCESKNTGGYHFSLAHALETLGDAYVRGHRSLYFTGGEPMLWEDGTRDRIFTCCRDVENPSVCATCGYANCVEVSQILALKPSAIWQVMRLTSGV